MLIKCASARRHQCLERLQFYWRTEEVLVLVCTFIKETWPCDGGWHKTWQHPPSESVEVCSTTSIMSRLYRAGSVPYVSTSGGMSNELNNTISRSSNGVFEGVAIGGKRELGSPYFLLITCFATTMHLAPRFCCFGRGRWHGWNPWKVATLRNPRWCVGMCMLFGC